MLTEQTLSIDDPLTILEDGAIVVMINVLLEPCIRGRDTGLIEVHVADLAGDECLRREKLIVE